MQIFFYRFLCLPSPPVPHPRCIVRSSDSIDGCLLGSNQDQWGSQPSNWLNWGESQRRIRIERPIAMQTHRRQSSGAEVRECWRQPCLPCHRSRRSCHCWRHRRCQSSKWIVVTFRRNCGSSAIKNRYTNIENVSIELKRQNTHAHTHLYVISTKNSYM